MQLTVTEEEDKCHKLDHELLKSFILGRRPHLEDKKEAGDLELP